MKASLSRSQIPPKPPKVCITNPNPVVGGYIWIDLVDLIIQELIPGSGTWWLIGTAIPRMPNDLPGDLVTLEGTNHIGPFFLLLNNQLPNPIQIQVSKLDLNAVQPFNLQGVVSGDQAVWYQRLPATTSA